MPMLYSKGYVPKDNRFVKVSETELYALRWPQVPKKELKKPQPIDGEIWRDIDGMEGIYKISNLGRVKSFKVTTTGKTIEKYINGTGDRTRVLLRNGKLQIREFVSRLVLKTFDPRPIKQMNSLKVLFIDLDKTNLSLSNLRWAKQKEVNQRTEELGMTKPKLKTRETIHPLTGKKITWKTRFSEGDISDMIRMYRANISPVKIGEIFDCQAQLILKYAKGHAVVDPTEQMNQILERETTKKEPKAEDELSK